MLQALQADCRVFLANGLALQAQPPCVEWLSHTAVARPLSSSRRADHLLILRVHPRILDSRTVTTEWTPVLPTTRSRYRVCTSYLTASLARLGLFPRLPRPTETYLGM